MVVQSMYVLKLECATRVKTFWRFHLFEDGLKWAKKSAVKSALVILELKTWKIIWRGGQPFHVTKCTWRPQGSKYRG